VQGPEGELAAKIGHSAKVGEKRPKEGREKGVALRREKSQPGGRGAGARGGIKEEQTVNPKYVGKTRRPRKKLEYY